MRPADEFADLPAVLRVRDLARLLGLSHNGVRALIRRGELPAAKLGRQLIVRRAALLARIRTLERSARVRPDPTRLLREMAVARNIRSGESVAALMRCAESSAAGVARRCGSH